MADYPDIIQAFGSEVKSSDGTVVDRAVSGKPRLRSYYTQVRDAIRMAHDLDDTEKGLLEAHYAADRLNSFVLNWNADGTQFTCRYAGSPTYKPKPGSRWAVLVNLVVV